MGFYLGYSSLSSSGLTDRIRRLILVFKIESVRENPLEESELDSCINFYNIITRIQQSKKTRLPMTYGMMDLINANVAEAVEVKPNDNLATIVQKSCLRLGNYRCPHDPNSNTQGIECMPEVWPLIFVAKNDGNALGNVLSAIRSGFGAHQAHIVKQLALSAEGIHRVVTFPAIKLEGDTTAEKLWTVIEPSVQMGRSLVNYLQGKTPKNVTTPHANAPSVSVSDGATAHGSEQQLSYGAVKQMIHQALRSRGQSYGHGADHGQKRNNGGQQRSNSNGGGKRRF